MSKKAQPKASKVKAPSNSKSQKMSQPKSSPAKQNPSHNAIDLSTKIAQYRKRPTTKIKAAISSSLISFIFLKYCTSCNTVYYARVHYCLTSHIVVPLHEAILVFNTASKSMQELPAEKTVLEYISKGGYIPFGSKIYINGEQYMHSYNLDSCVHRWLRSKLQRKSHSALTKDDCKIYTFGGKSSMNYDQKSCEVYNVLLNSWEHFPDCIRERSYHSVCKHGNCFYVTGGIHLAMAPNTFEKYTNGLNKWTEMQIKDVPSCFQSCMISLQPDIILLFSGSEMNVTCYEVSTKSGKFDIKSKGEVFNAAGFNLYPVVSQKSVTLITENYNYLSYDIAKKELTNDQNMFKKLGKAKLPFKFYKGCCLAFEDINDE